MEKDDRVVGRSNAVGTWMRFGAPREAGMRKVWREEAGSRRRWIEPAHETAMTAASEGSPLDHRTIPNRRNQEGKLDTVQVCTSIRGKVYALLSHHESRTATNIIKSEAREGGSRTSMMILLCVEYLYYNLCTLHYMYITVRLRA